MLKSKRIVRCFDPLAGTIFGMAGANRYLSDLRGCFADLVAYEKALTHENSPVYTVTTVDTSNGDGDLHYGIGLIMPGRIGDEYFMTKGHLHAWRQASEVYIGLSGKGVMLLEDETSGKSRMVPLLPNQVVYVPGKTAHRTINVGRTPLTYLGIYPAKAGHDYGVIATKNFCYVVIERGHKPTLVKRKDYLK